MRIGISTCLVGVSLHSLITLEISSIPRTTHAKVDYNTPGFNNAEFDALDAEFQAAKTIGDAIALSRKKWKLYYSKNCLIWYCSMYLHLEVYRDTVEFPFTDVLERSYLEQVAGYPSLVKVQS